MDAESGNKIDEAREALRLAHAAREAARPRLEAAQQIAERGRELVEQAAARLAERTAEAEAAEVDLGAAIAERLRSGEKPELGNAKLARCEEERAKAHSRHQVARRAHERLAADVEAARRDLQAAEAKVRECAMQVVADEAAVLAAELRAARAVVRDREARLLAAGRLPLGQLAAPLRSSVAVALEEPPQFAPQMDPESRAARRLRVYLDALARDPEASWGAIEEPAASAVAPAPQILFRPSTAGAEAPRAAAA